MNSILKQYFSGLFLVSLSVFSILALQGCGGEERHVTEGRVVYSIEYPRNRDNFFLYSILPKEMSLEFKGGRMESCIQKANLKNVLVVDCNQRKVSAYFKYGTEAYNVALTPQDVDKLLADQKKYTVVFTDREDTMAGFNVKQAIATAVKDPSDKIEIWYTEEIDVKNSNWYTPFNKIPGFLMAYSIDRYGLRMDYRARRFDKVKVNEDCFRLIKEGETVTWPVYNKTLGDLFQSFE